MLSRSITSGSSSKEKQPIGLALFALSATFAPAIGPTIGGYPTENWGWEYIFYVNLVPGAIMVGMLWVSLDRSPMNLRLLAKGDWPGIVTMAVGLAALQTVLEEGNKDDWFGSPFMVRLSVIAAVSLSLFFVIEMTTKNPLLNLRLLVRRNFGFGTVANHRCPTAMEKSVPSNGKTQLSKPTPWSYQRDLVALHDCFDDPISRQLLPLVD